MRKKLNYGLLLALVFVMGACGEKPEEVLPELAKEEEEEVVEVVEEASISGFSPSYMIEGQTINIQIKGAHFSENAEEVEVRLKSAEGEEYGMELQEATSSLITATVSGLTLTGKFIVQVKTGEQEVSATDTFQVHGKLAINPIFGSSLQDGSIAIEVGEYLLLTGENFSPVEANNQVWLIDAEGNETAAKMVVSMSDRLGFLIPETLPTGDYQMKIVTDVQELTLDNKLIVGEASPQINTVSPDSLFAGEELSINGRYFSAVAEDNEVVLKKDNEEVQLSISSASETEIVAIVPTETEAGEYILSVSRGGKTSFYNQAKIIIKPSPTQPVLNSINQTSFNPGETIILTGENLRKEGAVTNLNFVPFYGGTTLVRSATTNTEGTELSYTIPADFPSGSYKIIVEVGWEYSESYIDIIKIN